MKAILIGATGLIGKALLGQLLEDENYTSVLVLTRRSVVLKHPKLTEKLIDFNAIKESDIELSGDVLFSTLGTTLKTAGSTERQYAIDFEMQYNTAVLAAKAGVEKLILLSSAGAKASSTIFYSRMKGELDEAVKKLSFKQVSIIRPSMLTGNRNEFRWSEKIFTPIMHAFSWVPGIRKYRPIKDSVVAKAMKNAATQNSSAYLIYELEDVFKLAKTI